MYCRCTKHGLGNRYWWHSWQQGVYCVVAIVPAYYSEFEFLFFMQGGLIVKLTFLGTSLAFVSSHLAAHTQYVQHRNADFREIIHETRKHIGSRELDVMSEFDHVVWMGDLNYRIDLNLGKDPAPYPDNEAHHAEVRAMIERQEWDALLAADQLRDAIAQGQAFCGFEEGDSHFPPSYKVERAAGTTWVPNTVHLCCKSYW